jgi:hypothetical protein
LKFEKGIALHPDIAYHNGQNKHIAIAAYAEKLGLVYRLFVNRDALCKG